MLEAFRNSGLPLNVKLTQEDILTQLVDNLWTYDVIFSNAVIHWLGGHDNLLQLLTLCRSCLRRGGLIAFRFSLSSNAEDIKKFLSESIRMFKNLIDAAELPLFSAFLRQRWKTDPVVLKSHHGVFIAEC